MTEPSPQMWTHGDICDLIVSVEQQQRLIEAARSRIDLANSSVECGCGRSELVGRFAVDCPVPVLDDQTRRMLQLVLDRQVPAKNGIVELLYADLALALGQALQQQRERGVPAYRRNPGPDDTTWVVAHPTVVAAVVHTMRQWEPWLSTTPEPGDGA